MTKPPEPPSLPPMAWDTEFEPYALEIGFLVREWNHLQERLCGLFAAVLNIPDYAVSRAIWYVVPNDRNQRQMLGAAARTVFPKKSEILKEINWLLKECFDLGTQRDNTIHTPFSMMLADPIEFMSNYFMGNPKGTSLRGKKLLEEFRRYRAKARQLEQYAATLRTYVEQHSRPNVDWTKTPLLPKRAPLPTSPTRETAKNPKPQKLQ